MEAGRDNKRNKCGETYPHGRVHDDCFFFTLLNIMNFFEGAVWLLTPESCCRFGGGSEGSDCTVDAAQERLSPLGRSHAIGVHSSGKHAVQAPS